MDAVKIYKPSPKVYQLALRAMRRPKQQILFVSSNAFDVVGAGGLRRSEVAALDVGDVAPQFGLCRVLGKGGHEASMPLPGAGACHPR